MHRHLGLGLHHIFLGDKIQPTTVPHESVEGIKWENVRRALTSTWHRVTQTINYIISKFYNKLLMVDVIVLL